MSALQQVMMAYPSGSVVQDPDWSSVVLRMDYDAFAFVDTSPTPKAVTNTSVVQGTTNQKFGAGEGDFGTVANARRLRFGSAPDWQFLHNATAKWTIEGFFRASTFATAGCLWDSTSTGSTANKGIYIGMTTARKFEVYIMRGTTSTFWLSFLSSAITYPNDTTNYHFLQFTLDPTLGSNQFSMSVDAGTPEAGSKTGLSASAVDPNATLCQGALSGGGGGTGGQYDMWRITNGVIRPNTVPLVAYPTS